MPRPRIITFGLSALLALAFAQSAAGQTVAWTDQFATKGFDAIYALDDSDDDVYGVGETATDLTANDCSESVGDAIVRKYHGSGRVAWTRQFGTVTPSGATGCDVAEGVAAHGESVYVGGYAEGALPGQTALGGLDSYVRQYDEDGTELWTRQFGTTDFDAVAGAAADADGVYVAGQVCGALPNQQASGPCDAFVRKYDADGNELWTRQFGVTGGSSRANEVDVHDGAVVVVGRVAGALPGQQPAGGRDIFVRKYDAQGVELWTHQFGTGGSDIAWGVDVEGAAIYVSGDVGGALANQAFAGGPLDAFIRKYDADGNELWTSQFGTAGFDRAIRVAADQAKVVTVGRAGGSLDGQPFAGGATDPFARVYDTSGNPVWTVEFGSTLEPEAATGVTLADDDIFISGGVGNTTPGQIRTRGIDAFVTRLLVDEGEH